MRPPPCRIEHLRGSEQLLGAAAKKANHHGTGQVLSACLLLPALFVRFCGSTPQTRRHPVAWPLARHKLLPNLSARARPAATAMAPRARCRSTAASWATRLVAGLAMLGVLVSLPATAQTSRSDLPATATDAISVATTILAVQATRVNSKAVAKTAAQLLVALLAKAVGVQAGPAAERRGRPQHAESRGGCSRKRSHVHPRVCQMCRPTPDTCCLARRQPQRLQRWWPLHLRRC